jgi:hypothetical protein
MNAYNLSDEEDTDQAINTDPVGSAQQMLADLSPQRAQFDFSPVKQSVKRASAMPSGKSAKSMAMEYDSLTKGDLGAGQEGKSKGKGKARDMLANTFGAPTLTKGRLTKKRFQKGGEAKAEEPGTFGVMDYATEASKRMFPNQTGQDDQRDAARHMLAAGIMARKYGPGTAEFLGKAHERLSNPKSFFNMLGIGEPRYDYGVDVHNNRIGAELAARTKSQAELEALVQVLAKQATSKQVPGKPMILSREQLQAIDEKAKQDAAPPPEYRSEGSSEEGEVSQAEREAASRPAFVTPKSGKGRAEGPISRALASGDAYRAMAQGASDLPYSLAGAPVDLTTMLMRPAGYRDEKPVMGSDWIKEKMTGAGVRPATPTDPTQKGFHTAGDLLSNLVNPAGATRTGVRAVQKAGQAATDVARDFQGYNRQLAVPGASYAVRPENSTMMVRRGPDYAKTDYLGGLLNEGVENVRGAVQGAADAALRTPERAKLMEEFWNNKAANYFAKQFGTESDPVYQAIRDQKITSPRLARDFPDYILDQLSVGKTRTREGARPQEDFVGPGASETRFFPKYPAAFDATRKTYDKLTNISGALPERNPARVMGPDYTHSQSTEGVALLREMKDKEIDKMIAQGTPADQANLDISFLTRSIKDPDTIVGPYYAKDLLKDYEKATGTRIGDPNFRDIPDPAALPEQNLKTAIERGEPIYSTAGMQTSLAGLFDPRSINEYLASVPERELKNMRFEDAVKGGAKISAKKQERETLVADIKAGKRVPDKFFTEGVSAPLVQIKDGPLDGFAWKRIENAEATAAEGAYVGHSVGGYAKGGAYGPEKHKLFNEGKYRVYTLRDNRNRPVNTIEVRMDLGMDSEVKPVVTQIKGNGRATGNTAPVNYDQAVLQFFQDYLKPTRIEEGDDYLTPILQSYKTSLRTRP